MNRFFMRCLCRPLREVADFTTMDVTAFTEPTLLLLSLFMFIGASPSSVGGGIRTTTIAIMVLFVWNFARGRRSIKVFEREIHPDDVLKASAVMVLGITNLFAKYFYINDFGRFYIDSNYF